MQASVNGKKVTAVSRTNLSIKEVSVQPKPIAATTTPSLVEQTPRIQIKEGMTLNFNLLLAIIDDDFYYS